MRRIEVPGASLDAVEAGTGEPLVLVHGSVSDRRTWRPVQDALAARLRTIAYSRRHHGANARIRPGERYALARHVEDLDALLEACGAAPAHLMGHSYGALVCLQLASRAPERVRSLVLLEPPAIGLFVGVPPEPGELLRLAVRRPRTAAGIVKVGGLGLGRAAAAVARGDREGALRRLGPAVLGRRAFRALGAERLAQVRENQIDEELLHAEAMPRLDASALRAVRAPALLLGGARSPRLFARLLDALEELLPHTERARIPDASHLVHEDAPGRTAAVVLDFLARRAEAPGAEARRA